MENKVWTKAEIEELINKSNNAVERGIVAIFNRQTSVEKRIEDSRYVNNIGFSAAHAKRGTYYAKWVLAGKRLNNGHLDKGRELISHYASQLVKISNKEI